MVGPAAKREGVAHLRAVMGLSERRACALLGADRTTIRYRSRRPPEIELRAPIRDLANARKRFGYRRLFILLRQAGEPSGVNRIYRLYREEGLSVRKRRSRKRAVGTRAPIPIEAKANARWSLDFVHDQLASGRRFRVLNIVDDGTREGSFANFYCGIDAGYAGWVQGGRNSTMIEFKGSHFEREVILWGVRWYVAYPISYRQLEEMMEERGVEVDHSTLNRWVVKYAPELDRQFRSRKRPVGSSWRLDETYVKIKGSWKYLYRAVDKAGATVDFLLTAKRDRKAALRFLRRAIGQNGAPKKITIDKSGANTAAIESYNAAHQSDIEIRRRKYLNNIVEQDHRAIKRVARPTLGFKSFCSAAATLAGVELMHMIRKGQLRTTGKLRPAKQFYALAA